MELRLDGCYTGKGLRGGYRLGNNADGLRDFHAERMIADTQSLVGALIGIRLLAFSL
jgi:hypothetical protein